MVDSNTTVWIQTGVEVKRSRGIYPKYLQASAYVLVTPGTLARKDEVGIYFWNDPDAERYRKAYFSVYAGIWRHGDYVLIHGDTGGVTFYGRSDSVLMPSGVRIGTSEIYREMEKLEEISDSLAIGQQYKNDERIILFVKLNTGYDLTEALVD